MSAAYSELVKTSTSGSAKYAVVRPVPDTYDQCVRTATGDIDVALAKVQHAKYCRTLVELGLKLIWIDGDNRLPDSCFVEDTALVLGDTAIICNLSVKSRANEVTEVSKVMERLKDTYYIQPPGIMDGGDALRVDDKILVGISARTNLHAIIQLKEILGNTGINVIPVRVDNVLHLKSACTYLGNDYVVISKGCFASDILQGLRKIIVPEEEEYAADCLSINGTVLIVSGYPNTRKLVEKQGFQVKELEMSEFLEGDGALTCLSIIW